MRTVFAVGGVPGHPPLRFLTSRHTILSDVVDVMLAHREQGRRLSNRR
jgi:hypothetical protein